MAICRLCTGSMVAFRPPELQFGDFFLMVYGVFYGQVFIKDFSISTARTIHTNGILNSHPWLLLSYVPDVPLAPCQDMWRPVHPSPAGHRDWQVLGLPVACTPVQVRLGIPTPSCLVPKTHLSDSAPCSP